MNKQPTIQVSPRMAEQNKYNVARANLLAVLGFSAANTLLMAFGSNMYLLFSAWIPLYLTALGKAASAEPQVAFLFPILVAASMILLLPYLFCWIFSKKKVGWMVGALVYFSMDTLLLILLCVMSGDFLSMILDLLFHAWVLYYLIIGVRSGFKLKKLPAEDDSIVLNAEDTGATADFGTSTSADAPAIEDSPILRTAGTEEKIKVYAEARWNGHVITYRKYGKNTEELVVDGYVYAEYVFRGLAKPNTMTAVVGGLQISAGYFRSNFITINNQLIASTVRWI
jgi:hypothetical protein